MSEQNLPRASQKLFADDILTALLDVNPKQCKLFTNNVPITATTVLSDLTEASFGGYAPVAMNPSAFTAGVDQLGRMAEIGNDLKVFTADGTGPTEIIYGFYCVTIADTELWMAGNFDVPITMENNGDTILLKLMLQAMLVIDEHVEFVSGV